jgi:hypothetical protein
LDEKEKVIKKDNLFFFAKIKNKNVQSDLAEAFAKLNQVPLALFTHQKKTSSLSKQKRQTKNPNKNFFSIEEMVMISIFCFEN